MSIVEADISMSLDGFVTGPDLERHPGLGRGGEQLHAWIHHDAGRRLLGELDQLDLPDVDAAVPGAVPG